jgi:hypothetical protein
MYTDCMGFFDELGSLLGDVSSLGEELRQPVDDALQSVTESAEDLQSVKDDLLGETKE